MSATYAISQPTNEVSVAAGKRKTLSFGVSRLIEGQARAKIWLETDGEVPGWLHFKGEGQTVYVDFVGESVETLTVVAEPPLGTDPQSTSFKLSVASEDALHDTKLTGQSVALEVTEGRVDHWWWVKYAVAAGLVMMIAGGVWWFYPRGPDCELVDVPDLVGMPVVDASKTIDELLFDAEFSENTAKESESEVPGTVKGVEQSGAVCMGETLKVAVYKAKVPDLRRKRLADAKKVLDDLGLGYTLNRSTTEAGGVGKGIVFRTAPAAGQMISRETKVDLSYWAPNPPRQPTPQELMLMEQLEREKARLMKKFRVF